MCDISLPPRPISFSIIVRSPIIWCNCSLIIESLSSESKFPPCVEGLVPDPPQQGQFPDPKKFVELLGGLIYSNPPAASPRG